MNSWVEIHDINGDIHFVDLVNVAAVTTKKEKDHWEFKFNFDNDCEYFQLDDRNGGILFSDITTYFKGRKHE